MSAASKFVEPSDTLLSTKPNPEDYPEKAARVIRAKMRGDADAMILLNALGIDEVTA